MNALTKKEPQNNGNSTEFVRDKEGAELARMSIGTFRKLADEFGCVYRIGRTRLTNWPEFKKCVENDRG